MRFYFVFLLSVLLHKAALSKTYDILAYGAEADGKTINTKAIQKAIDACTPGDTVYVQTGNYVTGTIHLKSNITLFISKEGFLIGSSNINDYEVQPAGANGIRYGILTATNAGNINITGPGSITGGLAGFTKAGIAARPQQIMFFSSCANITVQNLSITNIPLNGIDLANCKNINILNLKLDGSPDATGARGLDLKSCESIRINGCQIWSENNAITISGHSRQAAINNCTLQSNASAIHILSADSGSVNNVTVNHVNINHSGRGIWLAVRHSGSLEGMSFNNIFIESMQRLRDSSLYGEPIYLSAARNADSAKAGSIKNISFNNILCNSENQVMLSGNSESLLQDIHFDSFVLNIRNSALTAVNVKPQSPAFVANYVAKLNINNIAVNWLVNAMQQNFSNAISVSNFKGLGLSNYSATAAPSSLNTHAIVLTDGSLAVVDAGDVVKVRVTDPKTIKPAPKPVRKKLPR